MYPSAAYHLGEPLRLGNGFRTGHETGYLMTKSLDSLRKIALAGAKALGVVAMLAAVVLSVVFVQATGRDTPVSLEANAQLQWSLRNYLSGPFAFMSRDERRELLGARSDIEQALALMESGAWTMDGIDGYCARSLRGEVYGSIEFVPGTTYGEVAELHSTYSSMFAHIDEALPSNCFTRSWSSVRLETDLPVYQGHAPGFFQVRGPSIVATNQGNSTVSRIVVQWEVLALGRPGSIVGNHFTSEIVGGLMPGESHTVRDGQALWPPGDADRLRSLINRFRDVDLEVRACVASVDGVSTQVFGRTLECLEGERTAANHAQLVAESLPELRELVTSPLLTAP